ncbi:hypothetical protein [Nocardioides sp. Root190]|uniref:hypothetical protein n=1 Tax=Nocardioides sp. Root190 TaxID=1736488 RepID=UPI0012F75C11|nr:hypothetical protein [Nocardioides sp. Root190]
MLRTTDHVSEVRTPARQALLARASVTDARDVVGLLLRVSGRAHGGSALSQFLARLESLEGPAFALGLLETTDIRVRRYAYGEVLARGQLEGEDLVFAVEGETDQWSRRLLSQHLVKLDPGRAKDVLLHGRYVEGRLIALFDLPAAVMNQADLERRLLDRSPRVREAAQWRYRQAGHDPASYYRLRWEGDPPDAEAAQVLSGLSETGQRLGIDEALAKSKSSEARVRMAGLQLWPKPGPSKTVLFNLLDDEAPAVVKYVAAELSKDGSVRYSDLNEAASSELPNVRRAAWLVRRGLGSWSRVRGDLEAMQDSDPGLSGLAESDLLKWLQYRAATVYQRPLPSEKAAIEELLASAGLSPETKAQLRFHAGLSKPAPEGPRWWNSS